MRSLLKFSGFVDAINEQLGRVVAWTALLTVLVGSWNAITRYLSRETGMDFHANALQDLQWYLFSAMFLIGAAFTLKRDEHVRVDVFYHGFKPRTRILINLAGHTAFLLPFCLVMIWTSSSMVRESWKILEGSPDPGGLVRYPVKTMIPIAFFLLFLQGLSEIIKLTRAWKALRAVKPS